MKIIIIILPTNGIRLSKTNQPLLLESCKRRIVKASSGINVANSYKNRSSKISSVEPDVMMKAKSPVASLTDDVAAVNTVKTKINT